MANLSNRLRDIFHSYLKRLDDEKNNPPSSSYPYGGGRNPYYGCRPPMSTPHQQRIDFGNDNNFKGVIYFYEWSNASNAPKTFFTLDAFERFLNTSLIFMASYQKELLRNIDHSYVACKRNSRDLIIKCNYEALKNALNEDESSNKGSEDKEPYNVKITHIPHVPKSVIQRPPMNYEPENRWDEMHPEVGGCWGW